MFRVNDIVQTKCLKFEVNALVSYMLPTRSVMTLSAMYMRLQICCSCIFFISSSQSMYSFFLKKVCSAKPDSVCLHQISHWKVVQHIDIMMLWYLHCLISCPCLIHTFCRLSHSKHVMYLVSQPVHPLWPERKWHCSLCIAWHLTSKKWCLLMNQQASNTCITAFSASVSVQSSESSQQIRQLLLSSLRLTV